MKTLYINCNMGAAGDMLGAALLELFPDRAAALAALNGMAIPGVEYIAESAVKCGILGTHLKVLVHGAEELPDGQTAACTAESAQPCIHAESDSHSHGCGVREAVGLADHEAVKSVFLIEPAVELLIYPMAAARL